MMCQEKSSQHKKRDPATLLQNLSLQARQGFLHFFGRFLSLCHKKQLPQGQNCFLMNILMNGGQLWPDDLRIKIIIKAGNGNLIRNPDSPVCKKIDGLHSCVIRRKCQCLCLQKMRQQLFIFFQSAPGFLGNHHIAGAAAEAAIFSIACLNPSHLA